MAALNHANICTLHDVGPNYLVMEFVDGLTFADRMTRGAMSVDEVLPIARQIADALEAAHERGIIHRDLKPENIKLTPDSVVKVLDFGLAKATEVAQDLGSAPTIKANASLAGVIIGTPAYMSPEQASGKPVDKRTDIWTYGVILWEMLAGPACSKGETISHIMAAVLTQTPDFPAAPPKMRPLLARCLIKDPKNECAISVRLVSFLMAISLHSNPQLLLANGELRVLRQPLWYSGQWRRGLCSIFNNRLRKSEHCVFKSNPLRAAGSS